VNPFNEEILKMVEKEQKKVMVKERGLDIPLYEEQLHVAGKSKTRVDAYTKVTGRLKYGADIEYPGALVGKVLRSPHAHALIKKVETTEAEALTGVAAILKAKDVPGKNAFGAIIPDQPVICGDKVRFIGDAVALVAAETEAIADQALALIKVEYEPIPAVFSAMDALKPDAPKVHEGGNLLTMGKVRRGDLERGFKEASFVLERTYRLPFQEHAYMEPDMALAIPHEDGTITVKGPMQAPFGVRKIVATVLGIPINRVQAVQTPLGGGFGGKDDSPLDIGSRAALLAWHTSRPVVMEYSREEVTLSTAKRHPMLVTCKLGAKDDGTLTAFEATMYDEQGAYASLGPLIPPASGAHVHAVFMLPGPYIIPNVKVDGYLVYTNNPFGGAMRGFGAPQANFVHESLIDELAEIMDMDPYEIRFKNALRLGAETVTGQVFYHSVGLKDAMKKARQVFSWDVHRNPLPLPEDLQGMEKRKGVGMSIGWYRTGTGAYSEGCGANLHLQEDGSVILYQGLVEMGQGSHTVLAQIAAEALGVELEDVRVVNPDTDIAPESGPTVASRSTTLGGMAILEAAKQIREPLLASAAEILGVSAENLAAKNRLIYDKNNPNHCVTLREAATKAKLAGRRMMGQGWWTPPVSSLDPETGQGNANFVYSYSAQMAEVEVDLKTGEVEVIRTVSAYDIGKAINPNTLEGQIEGGVSMGLGYALMEEIVVKEGMIQNLNLQNYTIPTVLDVPDVVPIYVEHPNQYGPYGAKGIGEMANIPVAAAITNAIANAIGARIYDLPANPERVYIALRRRFDEGFCSFA
jgi:CO/xanthine dehydrogenase Mo-binding subunit